MPYLSCFLCTPACLLNFEVKGFVFFFSHWSISWGLRLLINHSLSFLTSQLIERHKMVVFKLNMSQTEGLEKIVQGHGSLFISSSQAKYVIIYFFRFTTYTVNCTKETDGYNGQWFACLLLNTPYCGNSTLIFLSPNPSSYYLDFHFYFPPNSRMGMEHKTNRIYSEIFRKQNCVLGEEQNSVISLVRTTLRGCNVFVK